MNDNNDSLIRVNISADGYEAYISLNTSAPREDLLIDDLRRVLSERGIVFGVRENVLQSIVAKYKQGVSLENILAAEGIRPNEGAKPSVSYKFELSSAPKEDERGNVDYREITRFINVTKDQVLAVKTKPKPPSEGMKVTGEKIGALPAYDIKVPTGANVVLEDTGDCIIYKAACDGALVFERQTLAVFPMLQILQDVDFSVGNIHFKGNVKIGRDVLPDFVVEAEGHVSIWGSAIACTVKSAGNVEIRAGIVGKNKGLIQAGGHLTATFVENSSLIAGGDIKIKNGIIGSQVTCNGSLIVDMSRSRVVGSTIKAAKGISLCNVGSRFDTGATLITGLDPEKEEEFNKISKTLEARLNEAKELEKRFGRVQLESKTFSRPPTPELLRVIDKWELLKNQIRMINTHLKKTEELMYDYKAVIKVKETLFPRVNIQLGRFKITTSKEYFKVQIYYSEETEQLIIK